MFFDLLEQGIYLARRGMAALSFEIDETACDAFVAAFEQFLKRRAALFATDAPVTPRPRLTADQTATITGEEQCVRCANPPVQSDPPRRARGRRRALVLPFIGRASAQAMADAVVKFVVPFAAGRHDRHPRPADGAEAVGGIRPAIRRREQGRSRRQYRRRRRRESRDPTATPSSSARRGRTSSTSTSTRTSRSTAPRTSRRSSSSRGCRTSYRSIRMLKRRSLKEFIDAGEGPAGQAVLCDGRQRRHRSRGHGTHEIDGRHGHRARPVSRQRPGADRCRRRTCRSVVRQFAGGAAHRRRRKTARACRDHDKAMAGVARCADRGRGRRARLRSIRLVHDRGARENAARDHRQDECEHEQVHLRTRR